jgi:type VI protein secretion system component Hcp
VNYEKIRVNYEKIRVNYEKIRVNYEKIRVNYEKIRVNYEKIIQITYENYFTLSYFVLKSHKLTISSYAIRGNYHIAAKSDICAIKQGKI